ncbi:DUF6779 domain-containing protein [Actinokineospora globicatena]|uniref:DUF6779 domain-containing protein n=1 Tax=Actinokineospora globicatena TaxID=103729 RepID=UPI0020A4A277|nr:DUF6779 domain-containing protein [Actinokineospora globicatena]MCP2300916.1 hypothetical protein [Actinokineospora globicatena]GLW77457.1 hypothetical protein Aglo01_19390 [Actinokineospora globicatena]GLW84291.1 hypothetical protein Aglo02_19310 [Actinokineospora globicatena]
MTGRTDPTAQGATAARALLLAALALALASTAVLVLSDSLRWMRLGVVAALWAALAGAFLAARYRRQVADRSDEVAEQQRVYELELEREVAARREFELEVEATTRRKVEAETSDDLSALREELHHLRQSLEALLGGEVLVERFALHAEATRMRGLAEGAIAARPGNPVRHITAAGEPETQLIGRVSRNQWVRDEDPDRIDPDWTPSWESTRQGAPIPAQNRIKQASREQAAAPAGVRREEFAPVRHEGAQAPVRAGAPEASQEFEPVRRDAVVQGPARNGAADPRGRAVAQRPGPQVSQEFEPVRPGQAPVRTGAPGPEVSQNLEPVRAATQGRPVPPVRTSAAPGLNGAPGPDASQEFEPVRHGAARNGAPGAGVSQEFAAARVHGPARNGAPSPDVSQEFNQTRNGGPGTGGSNGGHGPARPGARPDVSQEFEPVRHAGARNGTAGPEASKDFRAGTHVPNGVARRDPATPPPGPQEAPRRDATAQSPVRRDPGQQTSTRQQTATRQQAAEPPRRQPVAREAQPTPGAMRDMPTPGAVQRPRAAERTEVAMTPAPDPGGRRRALTGTFPPVNAQHADEDSGGRRRRAEGAPTWHETIAAEEPQEDTGSHSSGKSVSELLAAHGTAAAPRRHRRRGED